MPTYDLRSLLAANSRTGMASEADSGLDADSAAPPDEIFETVLDHVQREYVESVDDNTKLSNGALARMFASLDDVKSRFLDSAERRECQNELKGHFGGIGAVLAIVKSKKNDVEYNHLTVVDTMPGSPAERAGLRCGDHLTELDGHWIINYSPRVDIMRLPSPDADKMTPADVGKLNAAYDRITEKFKRGYTVAKALPLLTEGADKTVDLTLERPGTPEPFHVRVTTGLTEVSPVEFRLLGDGLGYLRVRQFNASAADGVSSALGNLNPTLRGLVVDLRGNPGGMRADPATGADGFGAALSLIAHLTHGGAVAIIEHRPNERQSLVVRPVKPSLDVPLVVLVDRGTANLAELAASALKEAGKARIIGDGTFGDTIVQKFAVFRSGGGAEFAHLKFLTAKGVDLSAGLLPDIPVATGGHAGVDEALKLAIDALHSKV